MSYLTIILHGIPIKKLIYSVINYINRIDNRTMSGVIKIPTVEELACIFRTGKSDQNTYNEDNPPPLYLVRQPCLFEEDLLVLLDGSQGNSDDNPS